MKNPSILTAAGLVLGTTTSSAAAQASVIGAFQATFLGTQTASNSCSHRDLGFAGQLGGQWYAVYGDALWCDAGVTDPDQDPAGFHGMARNGISRLNAQNPLSVEDLLLNGDTPVAHPGQFIRPDEAFGETALYPFGVSAICETDGAAKTGAIYILVVSLIHRLSPS